MLFREKIVPPNNKVLFLTIFFPYETFPYDRNFPLTPHISLIPVPTLIMLILPSFPSHYLHFAFSILYFSLSGPKLLTLLSQQIPTLSYMGVKLFFTIFQL